MLTAEDTHIILKLMIGLNVERMSRRGRAAVESAKHLNNWAHIGGCYLVTGPEKLVAQLVDHIFGKNRRLRSLHCVRIRRGVEAARNQIKPANAGKRNVHMG